MSLLTMVKAKNNSFCKIIDKNIRAIRKLATDRTTNIIEKNIDRNLLSINMYVNQALIKYSKNPDVFDAIEKISDIELTKYLKNANLNILNFDSFSDDSDSKKFVLFPYAGGKQGVNKTNMQALTKNAFNHKKYTKFVDAFAGAFGATYNILPVILEQDIKEVLVNDINISIINTYRQVQRNPNQVMKHLASISIDNYKEFNQFQPETREEARRLHVKLEAEFKKLELQKNINPRRAALFMFLIHKSTGGMLDYDMKTKTCFFETSYKVIDIDRLINKVKLFHVILNSVKMTFKSVPYQTLFKTYKNDKDTLILIDPPYIEYQEENETTKGCSFTYGIDFDQQKLLGKVENLACDFIYYNNHNPLIENFANKNGFDYMKNSRIFNNNSEGRKKSVEIRMTKFTASTNLSTSILNKRSTNNYVDNSMAA